MGGSLWLSREKGVGDTSQTTLFADSFRAPSPSLSMTRADASSYKSMVSENTPLLERGAGSWWDRHRTPLVASALLLFTAIISVAVGVRFGAGTSAALGDSRGMVPMISPIGNEEFGRTLVGVLGTEGLGIAYQTMVNYECLARRLGRRLVMVPLVTEHFDDVPLDLAELFQFDDGDMVPLSQAPHDIMARVWTQYGNGESTNQWVHGGSYGAASVYFSKFIPGEVILFIYVWAIIVTVCFVHRSLPAGHAREARSVGMRRVRYDAMRRSVGGAGGGEGRGRAGDRLLGRALLRRRDGRHAEAEGEDHDVATQR